MNASRKFHFYCLGCPKNVVDGERMLALLHQAGYELVDDASDADFAVIHTCGFVRDARDESLEVIRAMCRLKRDGQLERVIVTGCLAERDRQRLTEECPEVDRIVGVFAREEIASLVDAHFGDAAHADDGQLVVMRQAPTVALPDPERFRVTPGHFAYLKISEGCDRHCTFCTIPDIRGPHASKEMEAIVSEARGLAADGVKELILVAQDSTYYGIDTEGRPMLAELLRRLDAIDRFEWIRLMYLYPMHVTDELIEVLADGKRVLPYLDIPLQHISDEVLRRMGRRHDRQSTIELLRRLRKGIPGLVLRTTFITGFPGETDEQFEELVEFTRMQRFERMGAFAFSPEEGTPAADFSDQLSAKVKQQRRNKLMRVQYDLVMQRQESLVGTQLDVIIDAPVPEEPGAWIGRTMADAPEVDGAVFVTSPDLVPGMIVPCEIVMFKEYDLVAVPV